MGSGFAIERETLPEVEGSGMPTSIHSLILVLNAETIICILMLVFVYNTVSHPSFAQLILSCHHQCCFNCGLFTVHRNARIASAVLAISILSVCHMPALCQNDCT